jgi:hypothetical protein
MATIQRKPNMRLPFRQSAVVFSVDVEERHRTWTFYVETGIGTHALRLSHSRPDRTHSVTVAYVPVKEAMVRAIENNSEEAIVLARQFVDLVSRQASELPNIDGLSYLRWRICEAINKTRSHIRKRQASERQA